MRVLMFGWEFPPENSGGLGTACLGLTKALATEGTQVTFVLPFRPSRLPTFMNMISADMTEVDFQAIYSPLSAYITAKEYERVTKKDTGGKYAPSLVGEVLRYAGRAVELTKKQEFDVIHAHDWLSLLAALEVKKATGKPYIAHIHATEWDRSGGNPNPDVFEIEQVGLAGADHVIANSIFTKDKIVEQYGIPADRVAVVYNGYEPSIFEGGEEEQFLSTEIKNKKIVLYVGRLSMHKGPDWLLQAAPLVLEHEPNTLFIIAGSGEMRYRLIEYAAQAGISDRVIFTGFVRGSQLEQLYEHANVYVMPSVSEPFGIAALEAMNYCNSVIMSKQSGIAETVSSALKVDYWDTRAMAEKIIAALQHHELHQTLVLNGYSEAQKFTWKKAALEIQELYNHYCQTV